MSAVARDQLLEWVQECSDASDAGEGLGRVAIYASGAVVAAVEDGWIRIFFPASV